MFRPAGAPDAEWGNELGALHVGFTFGAFDLVVPGIYPLTGSGGPSLWNAVWRVPQSSAF